MMKVTTRVEEYTGETSKRCSLKFNNLFNIHAMFTVTLPFRRKLKKIDRFITVISTNHTGSEEN